MSQSGIKLFIVLLVVIVAFLGTVDAKYSLMFAKGFFSLLNFVYAFFVFRSLMDMNSTFKSPLFPVLLLGMLFILLVPLFILLGLFL